MKIYIQVDIEGIAGMADFENREDTSLRNWDRIVRLRNVMTEEVNAAVRGAFDGGASKVTVWDSHGDGYSILFEKLDPRCELIRGNYSRAPWLPFFEDGYDGGFYLGAHAMAGTPFAALAHSRIVLNNKTYGEAGAFITLLASKGLPTLLLTGDKAAVEQVLSYMPRIEHVITKTALGPYVVKTRIPEAVNKEIYKKARRAVTRRKDIPVYEIKPPYKFKREKNGKIIKYSYSNDLLETYRRYLGKFIYEEINQCTGRPRVDKYLDDKYKHSLK
ncbi:MAG: M55 family metallopeptidase [bacterium]